MFPKPTRIKDKDIRERVRRKPCLVCGALPCDAAHIKTVGSGGGDKIVNAEGEIVVNLIPLCRKHHVEQHAIGIDTFFKKYSIKV